MFLKNIGESLSRPTVLIALLGQYVASNAHQAFYHEGMFEREKMPHFHLYKDWERGILGTTINTVGETLFSTPQCDAMYNVARDDVLGMPTGEEEIRFRKFVPHIRNAVAMTRALDNKSIVDYVHQSDLEETGNGILVVSKTGHALYCNKMAERICAANDGLLIRNKVLHARCPKHQTELDAMFFTSSGFHAKASQFGDRFLGYGPSVRRPCPIVFRRFLTKTPCLISLSTCPPPC